ncbi:MAG: hypothetical protein EA398_04910 [Deltaproteobacteria bacterium]|nr:MAG: hypothetical protein EA398_04910 [Deltaproteobacteria bacterium]
MLTLALSVASIAARIAHRPVTGPRVRLRLLADGNPAALERDARALLVRAGRVRFDLRTLPGGVEVQLPVAARALQNELAGLEGVVAVHWTELDVAA